MSHIDMPIPECREDEYKEVAWGLNGPENKFSVLTINRPKVTGEHDVRFKMLFCGVCHSDVHLGLNHLGGSMFPMVPGHELVGVVEEVGAKVTKVKVGDHVGVGCISDSCLDCASCSSGDEQYCQKGGNTHTYNAIKQYGHIGGNQDTQTFGGYSGSNTIHERFILKMPKELPLEQAAPILCAGITLWDPLRHWGATTRKNMTIGIVGIGGLGTMGIKLAKALGHTVYAFSTTSSKKDMAKQKGADVFVCTTDPKDLEANAGKCDLILNTISAQHDINPYLSALAQSGTLVQLGLVTEPHSVNQLPLIFQRKSLAGSLIGGIQSTQEVLDFCAQHQILPDVQLIKADQLEMAWNTLSTTNKDAIRFVIDIQESLKQIK